MEDLTGEFVHNQVSRGLQRVRARQPAEADDILEAEIEVDAKDAKQGDSPSQFRLSCTRKKSPILLVHVPGRQIVVYNCVQVIAVEFTEATLDWLVQEIHSN